MHSASLGVLVDASHDGESDASAAPLGLEALRVHATAEVLVSCSETYSG